MPSWTEENATALLSFIEKVGDEVLFARDYNPDGLAAAILGGDQAALDKAATDSFLLLATHLRDGRTPIPRANNGSWSPAAATANPCRSDKHTSEPPALTRNSYALLPLETK